MFRRVLRRAFTHPLVQFFVVGTLVFGAYERWGEPTGQISETVTISTQEQNSLVALFEKTWRRPPTAEELAGLIDARLREELFYREALALGLDEADVVVRRRLAQKMEFILDDLAAGRDPTDAELEVFMAENPASYSVEPSFTFEQVFLSSDRRGAQLEEDAETVLNALREGAAVAQLGDAGFFPRVMEQATPSAVARLFGEDLGESVSGVEPGAWRGPLRSAFGVHLVRLTNKQAGRMETLDEARSRVIRDWRELQRQQALEAYVDALKKKYKIVVEQAGGG